MHKCKRGHDSIRNKEGKCVECVRANDRARYQRRKAEKRAYDREYYRKNKGHIKTKAKQWQNENRERKNVICLAYYKRNREKVLTLQQSRHCRRPKWLSNFHIQQIKDHYKMARDITELTGVQYHVDHIVPLNGEKVSGLHVPWNLQVIPAIENISKSAKHNP